MEQTRKQGFGVREAAYFGAASSSGHLVEAIAVPLLDGGRVLGTMSMAWPHKAVSEQEIQDRIYPALCDAARRLVLRVQEVG
jgi:DNA-binding IclR family transcriptional regulator